MFYAIDVLLKNDKTDEFALVWRLAHQTTLTRKYKIKVKYANVKNVCANIVKRSDQFDLRTMSYLLMGTTTLFEMQVNDFDKFVQSILLKFKFVDGSIGLDKNLMQTDDACIASTLTKTGNVAELIQFEEGIDFDQLDIVNLNSEFVSIKQLASNQSGEKHLQMESSSAGNVDTQNSVINGGMMIGNNHKNIGDDSDFDNMPFNISIIRQPASQSENDNGYLSVAGSEYFNIDNDDDDNFGDSNNENANNNIADEDVDLMPPPPPKRFKMSRPKIDESIQLNEQRVRYLINDASSLLRSDAIGPIRPFPILQPGVTSLRFLLHLPSIKTNNKKLIEAFKLSTNSSDDSVEFNEKMLRSEYNRFTDNPEVGRGGNDNDEENFGDDEMAMDIDQDEAFTNDRSITDLDEKNDDKIDVIDDSGFDDPIITNTKAVLVDDDTFKTNLNNCRKLISPTKLLSIIFKYQKQPDLKQTSDENKPPLNADRKSIIFQNLVEKELVAHTIPNKKRLAAKFFHALLKLKMTNKINISQNTPYGNICVW